MKNPASPFSVLAQLGDELAAQSNTSVDNSDIVPPTQSVKPPTPSPTSPLTKSLTNQSNKLSAKQRTRLHLQAILADSTHTSPATTDIPTHGNTHERAEDAAALFAHTMHGVHRIAQDQPFIPQTTARNNINTAAKRQAATQLDSPQNAVLQVTMSEYNIPIASVHSEATLSYKHPTLQNRVFNQIKQGELRWYMAVDLHGCTVEEARGALLELIEAAQAEGHTLIKITHGKGPQAILKSHVNLWLKQHPQVLAFHSCIAKQGGTGAVLVLLKKA